MAMADEVWAWCEKAGAFGRTVTVKVKFADFHQVTRSRSFPSAIARHELLLQASIELVRTLLPTARHPAARRDRVEFRSAAGRRR